MSFADVILVVIWVGVCAYGVFGGADFGAGIWDLFAGGPERGAKVRSLLERAIGPVWEANHVWLIFVLVYAWTAFPEPFVAIATTLYIPLTLTAFGIILRGTAFAFRKWSDTLPSRRFFGATFAASSVLTPFLLGTVAGAVASARVPLGNAAGDPITSWLNPTSLVAGLLAVVACAFMAAVLVCRVASAEGSTELTDYFRRRAFGAGAATGVVALAGIVVLRADAPALFEGLTSARGIPILVVSAVAGIVSLWLLVRDRFVIARAFALLATVSVLWGWAVGQYPYLLEGNVTVDAFAAPKLVLTGLLIAFAGAVLIVIPALAWLFSLTDRGVLTESDGSMSESSDALLERLTKT
ncbi:MAG: cytochrome d ubiquinol oxidase subunit II [Gammaproteobacteria bacterium]|nr:cytochrome d ubiquinol oxidase subunit II [Gammaproteobacteria bacterium]